MKYYILSIRSKIIILIGIFLLLNAGFSEASSQKNFNNSPVGASYTEQINENSHINKTIIREVFDLGTSGMSMSQGDPDSKIRSFLSNNAIRLNIDPDNLVLSSSYIPQKQESLSIIKYTQTYKGLPVHSSSVIVGIRGGNVVTLKSNYYPKIDINTEPTLGEAGILEVVEKDVGDPVRKGFPKTFNIKDLQSQISENVTEKKGAEKPTNVEGLSLVIYPGQTNAVIEYHLAYKVELGLIKSPPAKWVYFVDANNGEILEKYNRVVYSTLNGTVTGSVYSESPIQTLVTRNFSNMTLFDLQTYSSNVFWSGKGDNLSNYITTKTPISLSGVSSATLEFKTKYSIEYGYDAGYVTISTNGIDYYWYEMYTGNLTNWSTRKIDLSSLAGQQIWLRFYYFTDESVQYDGMYIDDIKIETNLGTKFSDSGNSFTNWNNVGFSISVQNVPTAIGNTSSNGSYSLSGLPGSFVLHSELLGPYAQAYNYSGGINEYLNINVNTPSTQNIDGGTYDTSYKNEQSNAFYHVNKVHDFFTKGSPFNIYSMNYQTTAYVQYPDICNAFSDGRDIYFYRAGGGCEATSLFSDIIYHEYTHSVVDHVYTTTLPYVNESGALNEGWADYFAGTINNNSCIGEGFLGACLRYLNNTFRYPDDIVGEVHDDSRIVSGAAWDLRQLVGNTTSDGLIINAMKLEPFNFSEYLEDIIVADDNNSNLVDGTPHLSEICTAFYNNHGILSPYCIGVNLTVDSVAKTTIAGTNATYTLILTNNGTATDTYNLTVTNPNGASVAALNISGNITLASNAVRVLTLNVTNTSVGTFYVNVTAMSNNATSKFMYVNTTTIAATYGANLTVDSAAKTTIAGTNATYTLILRNNGTAIDTYNLTLTNPNGASVAALNINGNITLASSAVRVLTLNVTNTTTGTLYINVTARSNNDSSKLSYVNTTTTVVRYGVNLTNISLPTNATRVGTNATYTLRITNNGTAPDSYNLTVINANGASVALLNISSPVYLNTGASQDFNLNVTNSNAGTFYVNVTAKSSNDSTKFDYINTTTTVIRYGVSLTNSNSLTQQTTVGTNATYILNLTNNGTVADTYTLTVDNASGASVAYLNISSPVYLNSGGSQIFALNVTNTPSGKFYVNITASSNNDSSKVAHINTTTIIPVVITITAPANNTNTTDNYVNVTANLDNSGAAQLNWQGLNYSMNGTGTGFWKNMTDLLSGNYSFKVYANGSDGVLNVSETRIVTVNLTNTTNISALIDPTTGNLSSDVILISPSKNVTVTIFNGTNVTVNGTAPGNISIDSPARINATLTGYDRFAGENLTLDPSETRFIPDIQMRFNYTDSQLTAAGIEGASTLRIRFYNTTSLSWVVLTTYTLNQTGKYITANASYFGTFALIGTASIPCTTCGGSSSSSSGGGGGGGGGASGENYSNIELKEKRDNYIFKDKVASYKFNTTDPIMYVNITGNISAGDVTTMVEVLRNTSTLVTNISAPGLVYKNVNIWVGTSGFATPKNIQKGVIRFRVLNSWLEDKKLTAGDVRLVKWDGSGWIELDTYETTKGSEHVYYEAVTDSFSPFAITAIRSAPQPVEAIKTSVTANETPAPEKIEIKREGTSGLNGILLVTAVVLVIIVAILAAVYLKEKKKI